LPIFEIYDKQKPRSIKLTTPKITIGRTSDNGITIKEKVASRIHCELRQTEAGYLLRDLQSRNGTWLNDIKISTPMMITSGDEIIIGNTTLRYWENIEQMHNDARALPFIDHDTEGKPVVRKLGNKAVDDFQFLPDDAELPTSNEHAATDTVLGQLTPIAGSTTIDAPPPQKSKKRKVDARKPTQSAPAKKATHPKQNKSDHISFSDDDLDNLPQRSARGQVTVESALKAARLGNDITQPDGGSALELTINDLIPINSEGKLAHTKEDDVSKISVAMLRIKQLLLRAIQFGATDIHVEPKTEHIVIRYRIDGFLHANGTLDHDICKSMHSVTKLLCGLDIHRKGSMQDGSFAVQLPNRRIDLRVSFAPTTMGEKLVIRVLDKRIAPVNLESLGMEHIILEEMRFISRQESSMIIVCGPTGSGKTTTVYALLQELNSKDRNIVTVEDPVEYVMNDMTQIQIDPKNDVTFGSAMKSLLRQDPDVILIGEIRDAETARMAVQAATTGHLVLSTLHARDAIGSVFRLLDLEVEPFMLGSALTAVLSQRLMRKLCPKCKLKTQPSSKILGRLKLEDLARHQLYAPCGCDACMDIGFYGRVPIFEMLSMTEQVREVISLNPTITQLRQAAGDWIFQTLREDAIRKIRQGTSSLEEFNIVGI
jgi:type II secretory ATPase GspE/PulE/Tfp pilus assembly ATPase PilB-like protein